MLTILFNNLEEVSKNLDSWISLEKYVKHQNFNPIFDSLPFPALRYRYQILVFSNNIQCKQTHKDSEKLRAVFRTTTETTEISGLYLKWSEDYLGVKPCGLFFSVVNVPIGEPTSLSISVWCARFWCVELFLVIPSCHLLHKMMCFQTCSCES